MCTNTVVATPAAVGTVARITVVNDPGIGRWKLAKDNGKTIVKCFPDNTVAVLVHIVAVEVANVGSQSDSIGPGAELGIEAEAEGEKKDSAPVDEKPVTETGAEQAPATETTPEVKAPEAAAPEATAPEAAAPEAEKTQE